MSDIVVFIIFAFWLIGICIALFKKDVLLVWKISVLLVFLFYVIWHLSSLQNLMQKAPEPWNMLTSCVIVIAEFFPLLLFILWPLILWQTFNIPAPLAEKRIRFLVLITLFYWLFWFVSSWMGTNPEAILKELLQSIDIPALPEPPIE